MKSTLAKAGLALCALLLTASWAAAGTAQALSPELKAKLEAQGIQLVSREIPLPTLELKDVQGRKHQLEESRGKTLLLFFWASW